MTIPTLVFIPIPATGEDCLCSCVICHTPRREEDGVERGKPVEWLVRMQLGAQTIWQGLHTECWERNRDPIPEGPTGPPSFKGSEATFAAAVLSEDAVARALTELKTLRALLREGMNLPQHLPSDELLAWSRKTRQLLDKASP